MKHLRLKLLFALSLFIAQYQIIAQTITRKESVQSLYIQMFNNSRLLGTATGFVIKSKTQNYLITNWHVVTNKSPATKSWIDTNFQVSPNKILIAQNAKALGNYSLRLENLIDNQAKAIYKEFTIGNEMIDVVAIPLKDTLGDIALYPVEFLNEIDSILLQPTDRLFVLGFPKGMRSAPILPIWKSGLIASEPDIDQDSKPLIWLDIASYGGMSGSPVYLISDKLTYKNGTTSTSLGGAKSFFVGVFSHETGSVNIGALWKVSYLKKLFDSLP